MSQADKAHFFSTLLWIIIGFLALYIIVYVFIFTTYYSVFRGRYEYENLTLKKLERNRLLILLLGNLYFVQYNNKSVEKEIFLMLNYFKSLSFFYEEEIIYNQKLNYSMNEDLNNVGYVFKVSDDIVYARGLLKAQMSEMVIFRLESNSNVVLLGIINYLDNEGVAGITVLGDASILKSQTMVIRTNKQPQISAGYEMLGRVVNPIGEAIDGKGKIEANVTVNIEQKAPSIIARKPVREPLETGVKFIDSMIPIGCGQRELIIGDKKTGKTAIAIDTIINQKGNDIICIYVAIGQKKSSIARVVKVLEEKGCMEYTVVVSASASDSAALQYLAPYSGCAIGEYFRDHGRKVVIFYDDLSKHAVAYRQMSLLLRRPPGREGYPGDVFYIHSRLLERAAKLNDKKDNEGNVIEGGSLTALPIIETIQGDVSAYIPTNVISITDGQIFLEASLFNRGIRPAISPGISVSRVGSAAQNKVIKKLAGSLKLELAQYREMEEFARLGLSLDESSVLLLEKGRRLVQLLNQPHSNPVNMICQIVLLFGGLNGMFSDINIEWISIFERKILFLINNKSLFTVLDSIGREELPEEFYAFCINLLKVYLSNNETIY
jgi:F-type H+/Na+-transporting ATPase subunit alpha